MKTRAIIVAYETVANATDFGGSHAENNEKPE